MSRPSEILAELANREIRTWKQGANLRLSGPLGRMTAELRSDLASQKNASIKLVDNHFLAHKRTGYADWPEPERKRGLVRLWPRHSVRAFYNC